MWHEIFIVQKSWASGCTTHLFMSLKGIITSGIDAYSSKTLSSICKIPQYLACQKEAGARRSNFFLLICLFPTQWKHQCNNSCYSTYVPSEFLIHPKWQLFNSYFFTFCKLTKYILSHSSCYLEQSYTGTELSQIILWFEYHNIHIILTENHIHFSEEPMYLHVATATPSFPHVSPETIRAQS